MALDAVFVLRPAAFAGARAFGLFWRLDLQPSNVELLFDLQTSQVPGPLGLKCCAGHEPVTFPGAKAFVIRFVIRL